MLEQLSCQEKNLVDDLLQYLLNEPEISIQTDSRCCKKGDIFVSIGSPESYTSHQKDAMVRGVALVLSEHAPIHESSQVIYHHLRKDRLVQVCQMAAMKYRAQLKARAVVAITGSVGKTTTKRLLECLLHQSGSVTASPDHQNGQLGVALAVLNASKESDFLLFEAGIDRPGSMDVLASMIAPDKVLITNIHGVHLQRLKSTEAIAKEKAKMYRQLPESGTAYINLQGDYAASFIDCCQDKRCYLMNSCLPDVTSDDKVNRPVDCKLKSLNYGPQACEIVLVFPKSDAQVRLSFPLTMLAWIDNLVAAVAMAYDLGVPLDQMQTALQSFQTASRRLQSFYKPDDYWLIDDSFNASPVSVIHAMKMVTKLTDLNIVFVLGDMMELGSESESAHTSVGQYANTMAIDYLVTVGSWSRFASQAFHGKKYHCQTVEEAASVLITRQLFNSEHLLFLKASNSGRFDQLAKALLATKNAIIE